MHTPSAKTLMKHFPKLEQQKAIDLAARMKRTYRQNSRMFKWDLARVILQVFDKAMDNHGIEYIENNSCTRTFIQYSNAGDPYRVTLMHYAQSNTMLIGCWGDWVSRNQRLVNS